MARKTIKNENPTQEEMSRANYRDKKSIVCRLDEIWKPVIGIPNLQDWYYVSNYGRIYSKFTNSLIMPRFIGRGYLTVTLRTKDNKPIDILVHRLVMITFNPIENYNDYQVNHCDGIKINNRYENLEWATQEENMLHAYQTGLRKPGEGVNFSKITESTAHEICKLLETKKYTDSEILEILNLKNISKFSIYQIRVRNNWKHVSKNYDF